jgi:CRP/FNR family transcriptional regulator, cyclic AMP receptor protein
MWTLMRLELLNGLTEEEAGGVLALGSPVSLRAGEVLFDLGAEARTLYVIDRGCVVLTLPIRVAEREEHVLIEEREAGQALGWSALIPPHKFTLRATAQLDTAVVAFPRGALLDYFATRPAVGYAVMRNVAAVTGHRLQVFQAMWLREIQRSVVPRLAAAGPGA